MGIPTKFQNNRLDMFMIYSFGVIQQADLIHSVSQTFAQATDLTLSGMSSRYTLVENCIYQNRFTMRGLILVTRLKWKVDHNNMLDC